MDFTIGFADIPASIIRPIPRLHRRMRSRNRRRSSSPPLSHSLRSTSPGSWRPLSCDREHSGLHRDRSGSRKRLHLPLHLTHHKTGTGLSHAKDEDGSSVASSESKARLVLLLN